MVQQGEFGSDQIGLLERLSKGGFGFEQPTGRIRSRCERPCKEKRDLSLPIPRSPYPTEGLRRAIHWEALATMKVGGS